MLMQDDVRPATQPTPEEGSEAPQPTINDVVPPPANSPAEQQIKNNPLEQENQKDTQAATTPPKKKNSPVIPIIFAIFILLSLSAVAIISAANK